MKTTLFIPVLLLVQMGVFFPQAMAHPSAGIVITDNGEIFFGDLSRGVFRIDTDGRLSTVTTEGQHWLALDEKGSFSHVDFQQSKHWPRWFKRRTALGEQPAIIGDGGSPLLVGLDGNIYFVCDDERFIPAGLQIGRLTPNGKETLLNPDLRKISQELGGIKGLAQGPDGSLYATYPKAILKISLDGKFSTIANPVVVTDCEANVSTNDLPFLRALALDSRGTIYAAASGCGCVIKVGSDGKATTVLKAEKPWVPAGVAARGDALYVLEHINGNSEAHEDWPPRVRKLGRDGKVTTLVTFSNGRWVQN
jgi:hypothetical protein